MLTAKVQAVELHFLATLESGEFVVCILLSIVVFCLLRTDGQIHANEISIGKMCSVVKLGILFRRVDLKYDLHKGLETVHLDVSTA